MGRSPLIVFDFDGTATLAEEEAVPFVAAYREDLAAMLRLSQAEADARIDAILADIEANPQAWAFRPGGEAVCPASVDPYLRMSAVADTLFDAAGVLRASDDRARVTGGLLYRKNYELTMKEPRFRSDAREVFASLAHQPVYIVTNSGTGHVQEKVRRLGGVDWLVERVRGNARKFVVDATFGEVPERMEIPGLNRPVLLRRRFYHDLLDGLRRDAGAGWEDVWVVGDIFELDLALPFARGANVVLIANERTPPWEVAFTAPRLSVVRSLTEARALLPS